MSAEPSMSAGSAIASAWLDAATGTWLERTALIQLTVTRISIVT